MWNSIDKEVRRMKKKIILLALAFILLAIPAAYLQMRDGVMLDGRFFAQKNDALYVNGKSSVSISRNENGADISILLDGEELNAALIIENDQYTFAYEDGRTVQGYAGKWMDELVDGDGAPIWLEDSIVVVVGNEREPGALTREYSLSNILYHMVEDICEQRGHLVTVLMAMVIYALGIASFFWPEEVYFFGRRWRYANAELSYDGVIVQRIGGVVCALAGIVLLYAPLFW